MTRERPGALPGEPFSGPRVDDLGVPLLAPAVDLLDPQQVRVVEPAHLDHVAHERREALEVREARVRGVRGRLDLDRAFGDGQSGLLRRVVGVGLRSSSPIGCSSAHPSISAAEHEHAAAGPRVDVDAVGLAQVGVARPESDHEQDRAVQQEQPADNPPDVEPVRGLCVDRGVLGALDLLRAPRWSSPAASWSW